MALVHINLTPREKTAWHKKKACAQVGQESQVFRELASESYLAGELVQTQLNYVNCCLMFEPSMQALWLARF